MHVSPSLKRLIPQCRQWLDRARTSGDIDRYTSAVQAHLAAHGRLSPKVGTQLGRISHFWSVAACDAYFRADLEELARFFRWTIESRALLLCWDGLHSQLQPQLGNWPKEYSDSLRAAGPTVLLRWDRGKVSAQRFVEMAEKDTRLNLLPESRRIAHNTHDVFLTFLFCDAYALSTRFEPRKPLINAYRGCWITGGPPTKTPWRDT
ncbi:hypothetical protein [Pseudomonas sp. nanlin1]|uniref:hypothetical protein n=1 Tax=Pseudomonas sp. nanlin1 TaxID=3040605 RepID=UPI00388D4210